MNTNITLKELEEKLKDADKLKDIDNLNNDISEGKQVLKSIDYNLKLDYTKKIEMNYTLYVLAINIGMNLRVQNNGQNSTRPLESIDETITMYINMLILVRDGKLFEEILKVISNEKNKFEGGVFGE